MSIRRHGKGHQVRLPGEKAKTFPTKAAAEKYELNRKLARSLGELFDEEPVTVTEMLEGCIYRWQATKKPAKGTVDRAKAAAKVWKDEFGARRIDQLSFVEVEDVSVERAAEHPNSAKKELELFKRGLKDARRRGQRFDLALLMIDPVKVAARVGVALDLDELERLASWFPEQIARFPEFCGSAALRLGEALGLTDDRVDLKAGQVFIPAAMCKERRDKTVELAAHERALLAEQLVARTPGTSIVFPRAGGRGHQPGRWDKADFYTRVWYPARLAAAREWREDQGLGQWASTRFDELVPHDLRHTAISLMAAGGMRPEVIAVRVGHKDGGRLILERYRHLFPDELSAHLARYDEFLRERRQADKLEGETGT
jgi:integrase